MLKNKSFITKLIQKVSNGTKGFILILGRLFGIEHITADRFKGGSFITAIWIFMLGIPLGLMFFGGQFPMFGWLIVVMGLLMLTNLDNALTLTASFAERGVNNTIKVGIQ